MAGTRPIDNDVLIYTSYVSPFANPSKKRTSSAIYTSSKKIKTTDIELTGERTITYEIEPEIFERFETGTYEFKSLLALSIPNQRLAIIVSNNQLNLLQSLSPNIFKTSETYKIQFLKQAIPIWREEVRKRTTGQSKFKKLDNSNYFLVNYLDGIEWYKSSTQFSCIIAKDSSKIPKFNIKRYIKDIFSQLISIYSIDRFLYYGDISLDAIVDVKKEGLGLDILPQFISFLYSKQLDVSEVLKDSNYGFKFSDSLSGYANYTDPFIFLLLSNPSYGIVYYERDSCYIRGMNTFLPFKNCLNDLWSLGITIYVLLYNNKNKKNARDITEIMPLNNNPTIKFHQDFYRIICDIGLDFIISEKMAHYLICCIKLIYLFRGDEFDIYELEKQSPFTYRYNSTSVFYEKTFSLLQYFKKWRTNVENEVFFQLFLKFDKDRFLSAVVIDTFDYKPILSNFLQLVPEMRISTYIKERKAITISKEYIKSDKERLNIETFFLVSIRNELISYLNSIYSKL